MLGRIFKRKDNKRYFFAKSIKPISHGLCGAEVNTYLVVIGIGVGPNGSIINVYKWGTDELIATSNNPRLLYDKLSMSKFSLLNRSKS